MATFSATSIYPSLIYHVNEKLAIFYDCNYLANSNNKLIANICTALIKLIFNFKCIFTLRASKLRILDMI